MSSGRTSPDAGSGGPDLPSPDGLVLAPFRALRYAGRSRDALAAVTSPPYDVIDEEGVRRFEERDPRNVVRLILPRDDDRAAQSRYGRAARTLAAWRADGTVRADDTPSLYVYEQVDAGHVQRGLVGALGLVQPDAGIVLPHENTMAGPVADRLALTEATEANLEPIFLVYSAHGAAREVVVAVDTGEPITDVEADGVRHRIWRIDDPTSLRAVARDLHDTRAVIADGHHRYATYLRYQADQHAAGRGPGPWDHGLALLVDATSFGPQVHPIHRVISDLPVGEAAARAGKAFRVRPVEGLLERALDELAEAGRGGPAFLLAADDEVHLLTDPDADALHRAIPADRSPAWQHLDVTVAHRLLIEDIWGLEDREDVVGFAHDIDSALAAANRVSGFVLLLNATPVADVLAVAGAGERMPRKSTLFTPKPRTGLLMRAYADA